jgi:hypothetical protein
VVELLQVGYAGKEKDRIELVADLERGWRNLGARWGIDEQVFLDARGEDSKFRCRIRFVCEQGVPSGAAKLSPTGSAAVSLDGNEIRLESSRLIVSVPLAQRWLPTQNKSRNPSIYVDGSGLFRQHAESGEVSYRFQMWVVLHGQSHMFGEDKHEWGDGFAWVGGRPESSRHKF